MRVALLAPMICLMLVGIAPGQERRFPYTAIVDVDEEPVRSGNGPKFYVTGLVTRGTQVQVHRHDPGGWYMIAPPEGSFSWIRMEHVQKSAPDLGTVTANDVLVRVGSALSDDVGVYQTKLSRGATVQILGQQTFPSESGPVPMYKIAPPPREFRWIAGKAVVSADAPRPSFAQSVPAGSMPKKILPVEEEEFASDPPPLKPPGAVVERPLVKSARPEPLTTPIDTSAAEVSDFRQRLAEVDDRFRDMIKLQPPTWDLAALEQSYQQLEADAGHPVSATQLKLRLDAVARYAKIRQDWEEVTRLTSETRARDIQLLSMAGQGPTIQSQPGPLPAGVVQAGSPGTGTLQPPPALPGPLSPDAQLMAAQLQQQAEQTGLPVSQSAGVPQPQQSLGPPPPTAAPAAAGVARFAGAGVLQRGPNVPGAAPFVLVSLDNRLLAHLIPVPGLDLTPHVGRQFAVIGERTWRQDLQADVITVRQLQPVRLRP